VLSDVRLSTYKFNSVPGYGALTADHTPIIRAARRAAADDRVVILKISCHQSSASCASRQAARRCRKRDRVGGRDPKPGAPVSRREDRGPGVALIDPDLDSVG